MRLLRAGKAKRGAERQKERAESLAVKEISRTDIPDNPQGFTHKRPGDRFEIKKTQRPWKAVCLGSIADSKGPDLANTASRDVAKSEADGIRTSRGMME